MNNIEIVLSQNDICRLCMTSGNDLISIHSILQISNKEKPLNAILFDCTSLQVNKDDLYPQNVCKICLDRLTNAFLFREMCWETQKKIVELFDSFSSYCIKIGPEINCEKINDGNATNYDVECSEIEKTDNLTSNKSSEKDQEVKNGLKRYLCSICGKSFKQSQELTVHIRRHKGEKPYKCDKCTLSFVSGSRLTAHSRVHTGERPFICKICNSTFGHSSVLRQHLQTHLAVKKHQCNVCGKQFSSLNSLNLHKRTHTGEKPLKCELCKRSFADPNNLKQHVITHTKEKPFLCVICGKKFNRNQHLKKHMSNVHNNS